MSPTFLMFRSMRDISVVPGGSPMFPSASRQSSMSSKPSLRTTFSSLGAAAVGAEASTATERICASDPVSRRKQPKTPILVPAHAIQPIGFSACPRRSVLSAQGPHRHRNYAFTRLKKQYRLFHRPTSATSPLNRSAPESTMSRFNVFDSHEPFII